MQFPKCSVIYFWTNLLTSDSRSKNIIVYCLKRQNLLLCITLFFVACVPVADTNIFFGACAVFHCALINWLVPRHLPFAKARDVFRIPRFVRLQCARIEDQSITIDLIFPSVGWLINGGVRWPFEEQRNDDSWYTKPVQAYFYQNDMIGTIKFSWWKEM